MLRGLLLKGPKAVGFYWLNNSSELGSGSYKPTSGSIARTGIYLRGVWCGTQREKCLRIKGIRDGNRSRVTMASVIQLPVFKGAGGEDPKHLWFVLTSVWNT